MRDKGKLYVGRHEPLVTKETFLKVQEILDQRKRQGDRDITHHHYLKGLLRCGHCAEEGRTSRLIYSQVNGNGGTYEYLVCAAKQRKQCSMPWSRVEQIEDRLLEVVSRERLSTEALDDMREALTGAVDNLLAEDRDAKAQLRKQLGKLERQEERLIDLAASGTLPITKIRERIEHTTLAKAALQERLEQTADRLQYGADTAVAFMDLLASPEELYKRASDTVRRDLLLACFEHLAVFVRDERTEVAAERSKVNRAVRGLNEATQGGSAGHTAQQKRTPRSKAESPARPMVSSFDHGSSNVHLAGVPGLEPRTKVPETSVLPITPYPNGRAPERANQESSIAARAPERQPHPPADGSTSSDRDRRGGVRVMPWT